MSGLADRLVTAAREAVEDSDTRFLAMPVAEHVDVDPYLMAGRAAVVAVLMTLAESGQVAWAESLAGLAGVVERGEQA